MDGDVTAHGTQVPAHAQNRLGPLEQGTIRTIVPILRKLPLNIHLPCNPGPVRHIQQERFILLQQNIQCCRVPEAFSIGGRNLIARIQSGQGGRRIGDHFPNHAGHGLHQPHLTHAGALPPGRFRNPESAGNFHLSFMSRSLHRKNHPVMLAQHDQFPHAFHIARPLVHRMAVHFHNLVAGKNAGLSRRAVRSNKTDRSHAHLHIRLAHHPDGHGKQHSQQKRSGRPGGGHDNLVQGSNRLQILGKLRTSFNGLHRSHLRQGYKTSGRNPPQPPLHAVNRFFPDGTAKPDLKPVHIQTTPAGSEKMTKFMNKNHEVKQHHHAENNGDGGKDGKNAIHGSFCRLTYHGPLRRTSFKDVLMTKWMLIFQMDFKRCLTAQKTAFTFREF